MLQTSDTLATFCGLAAGYDGVAPINGSRVLRRS